MARHAKGTNRIVVNDIEYRWIVRCQHGQLHVRIWPASHEGASIQCVFGSHAIDAEPFIVTNRLVRRVIEYATSCLDYTPTHRGNDLSIVDIEDHIEWDDAIRRRNVADEMHPLLYEIAAYFPVRPVPSANDAIVDTYLVEHLHEILGGKPWTKLTPTECRHCSDGFNLLTPVGLHYYLPAYMTAEIVNSKEADVVVESLVGLFQGERGFPDDRYSLFWRLVTRKQMTVIGKWIDHYATKYDFNRWTKAEVNNAHRWVATRAELNLQAKPPG